jgi:hypothetical protein
VALAGIETKYAYAYNSAHLIGKTAFLFFIQGRYEAILFRDVDVLDSRTHGTLGAG